MLIVEENLEFIKFSSTASPDHECHRNGTKLPVFFWRFLRISFLKCSMKMLAVVEEMENPITGPEVCS